VKAAGRALGQRASQPTKSLFSRIHPLPFSHEKGCHRVGPALRAGRFGNCPQEFCRLISALVATRAVNTRHRPALPFALVMKIDLSGRGVGRERLLSRSDLHHWGTNWQELGAQLHRRSKSRVCGTECVGKAGVNRQNASFQLRAQIIIYVSAVYEI
jgi:hypothetical protein